MQERSVVWVSVATEGKRISLPVMYVGRVPVSWVIGTSSRDPACRPNEAVRTLWCSTGWECGVGDEITASVSGSTGSETLVLQKSLDNVVLIKAVKGDECETALLEWDQILCPNMMKNSMKRQCGRHTGVFLQSCTALTSQCPLSPFFPAFESSKEP